MADTFVCWVRFGDANEPEMYPYHLGTDERIAREYAESIHRRWWPERGPKKYVSLTRGLDVVFDAFVGGRWTSGA